MVFFVILPYAVVGYILYLLFLKVHTQLEHTILKQLLKEVYLCDCEAEIDAKGDRDISSRKNEIPVTKLYEASSKNGSFTGKYHIQPKRVHSCINLPWNTRN